MSNFKRILSFGRPYAANWPAYLLLSVLSVVFGIANYALLDPLLTVLFEPDNVAHLTSVPQFSLSADYFKDLFDYLLSGVIADRGVMRGLVFVCCTLIAATFLSDLSRYLSQRILVNVKTRLMKNLRSALFEKVSHLNIGFFNDRRRGDLLSSISNDVAEVQNSVASSFHIIFREPLLVLGFLAMLFYMSPRLTLVSLVALPLSGLVIGSLTRRLKRGAVRAQSLMGTILSHFDEAIGGSRIIKAFNAHSQVRSSFEADNNEHRNVSRSMFNRQELASPLSEFLGISVAVVVLFYGGWLNVHGQLGMDWPAFVVYIGFYWRVLEPLKAIANASAAIRRGMVSADRIFAILDAQDDICDPAGGEEAAALQSVREGIRFNSVSFGYGDDDVLHGVDFEIPAGGTVAIVGASGAGKSTIADLIPRFFDVGKGSITIDGIDIRRFRLADLRSLLGVVTQEAILFNDTIFNNIAFGMPSATMEMVQEAARAANAHEFIMETPDGYSTCIGDRGSRLSGGQRQRIAIARALLKNPPVLILDEATSALDTESEKLVQDALSRLMKGRTCLVIAHRLSTVRNADNILVLRDGHIVEQGTHESLIRQNGFYANLSKLQQ